MNEIVNISAEVATLPALIDHATKTLAGATTAAEVLEARQMATDSYDAAKRLARFAKAKDAHDAVVAAAFRMQADALLIESRAKLRLADEYDAAQERGEVQRPGGDRKTINVPDRNNDPAKVEDLGLTRKQIHDARQIRDAEKAAPGATEKAVNARLDAGEEPTRAALKRDLGLARKAERHAQQAEWDSQREENRRKLAEVNPKIAAIEAAKARNGSVHAAVAGSSPAARIAELESLNDSLNAKVEEQGEYIASLETENSDVKRRLATFDDMAVQYEQGGFEKVIAGKNEEIRVLETRLYSTNADMISWKKKAAWEAKEKLRYKHEAESRGYSDDADQTNPDNGEVVDEYAVF